MGENDEHETIVSDVKKKKKKSKEHKVEIAFDVTADEEAEVNDEKQKKKKKGDIKKCRSSSRGRELRGDSSGQQ